MWTAAAVSKMAHLSITGDSPLSPRPGRGALFRSVPETFLYVIVGYGVLRGILLGSPDSIFDHARLGRYGIYSCTPFDDYIYDVLYILYGISIYYIYNILFYITSIHSIILYVTFILLYFFYLPETGLSVHLDPRVSDHSRGLMALSEGIE